MKKLLVFSLLGMGNAMLFAAQPLPDVITPQEQQEIQQMEQNNKNLPLNPQRMKKIDAQIPGEDFVSPTRLDSGSQQMMRREATQGFRNPQNFQQEKQEAQQQEASNEQLLQESDTEMESGNF